MSILSEKAILNTEDVLMKIEEYSSQEAVSPFAKLNLKLLKNSIQNKHGLNMETKHDLVFIGKTRVGKSTNLCSIFNFYYYEGNKKLQMLPADTGGTTTPCTVEIDNVEGATYIEVTNIDNQMLQKYLKVFIQKKIDKDSAESLPEEIQAIIKRKIGKETISQIESIENPVQAVDYIFENTKVEYTNELVCLSPEDECGDINSTFKWVKETLDNIRHGKVEDVFIPLKVVIHISKNVRQLPEWANKIVDTRGIIGADLSEDNNGSNSIMNRDDLKEYINNKNSYVVFLTEFADMDNSIKEYYKELLTSTDSDISSTSRHMILISTKPDMVDSKISDEYENESEKEGLRRIVIAEKVESFEGSVLDFVSKLKDSNLERDKKSLEIYTNLVEKVDSFQETKIKLVNLVLFEAKKYYQEGELEEEHSRQIQGVISDKIKVIHSILDNEIRDACELAVSIIKSKTGKDRPSTRLENELETFKSSIISETEKSIEVYIEKYTSSFINNSSLFSGMTWRAYTYSSGFVISRGGDIVGDTTVIRNEIIEDLSREITLILKKSTQVLESDMKELVSDEELVIFLESLKIDLIGRAKVNLMNELKMQFEIELKKRILNHDSLWDQVHQKREKYGDKYSDIGKKMIREYLDRAFESKGISYDRYYTDNLEKAKNEISDKLLGSLNGNVIA